MVEIISFLTLSHALWVTALLMLPVSACKLYSVVYADNFTVRSIFFSLEMKKTWMTVVSGAFFGISIIVLVLVILNVLSGISAPIGVFTFTFAYYFLIGMVAMGVIVWVEMMVYAIISICFMWVKEWF